MTTVLETLRLVAYNEICYSLILPAYHMVKWYDIFVSPTFPVSRNPPTL